MSVAKTICQEWLCRLIPIAIKKHHWLNMNHQTNHTNSAPSHSLWALLEKTEITVTKNVPYSCLAYPSQRKNHATSYWLYNMCTRVFVTSYISLAFDKIYVVDHWGWEVSSRVANSYYNFWVHIYIYLSYICSFHIATPDFFYFHIWLEIGLQMFSCKLCLMISYLVTIYATLYECVTRCSEITINWKLK